MNAHRPRWIITDIEDEYSEQDPIFSSPTPVSEWERYVSEIFNNSKCQPLHRPLLKNLAHRLQFIEVVYSILLYDSEIYSANKRGTLHPTVRCFTMHTFCVCANSILEGIGAHFCRNGLPSKKLSAHAWHDAILDKIGVHYDCRQDLSSFLDNLSTFRDKIHLDRIGSTDNLHFNEFTHVKCFLPMSHSFINLLDKMNSHLPPLTILSLKK